MAALVAAVAMAAGVFYLYTALVLRWPGLGAGPRAAARPVRARRRGADWLVQAGLGDVDPRAFALVTLGLAELGVVGGLSVFVATRTCWWAAPTTRRRLGRWCGR